VQTIHLRITARKHPPSQGRTEQDTPAVYASWDPKSLSGKAWSSSASTPASGLATWHSCRQEVELKHLSRDAWRSVIEPRIGPVSWKLLLSPVPASVAPH